MTGREDFWAFRCCTNTCSLFFRRSFFIGFVLFSSLSSTKLLYSCIPLVMTELTAVMAAASTMTLESRAKMHRLQMDFQLPQKSAWTFISAEGFLRCMALLMVIHAACTFGCHAMLKAFEQTSNLWPSSHPPSQSTWIADKSYCTSMSFYHRIALLTCLVMCLCTTNPPLQKAWYTEGCLRVDKFHKGTLITIWRRWCRQEQNNSNTVTALSVSV